MYDVDLQPTSTEITLDAPSPEPTRMFHQEKPATTVSRFPSTDVAGHQVFRPSGALTYEVRSEFEQAAHDAAGARARLVLDCRDTSLMDSEFLEMLLDLQDWLVAAGGSFKVVNLSPTCRDIFAVTRLDAALVLYEDLGSAVRSR